MSARARRTLQSLSRRRRGPTDAPPLPPLVSCRLWLITLLYLTNAVRDALLDLVRDSGPCVRFDAVGVRVPGQAQLRASAGRLLGMNGFPAKETRTRGPSHRRVQRFTRAEASLTLGEGRPLGCGDVRLAAPRPPSSPFSHSEVCCSVWNAALSEALRRLGYYARRVNSPLSVPRAP